MIDFFGFKITSNLDLIYSNNIVINTINPHSFIVSMNDLDFKSALINSDILIPDGIGIVWGINSLYGEKIKRISGFDLFAHMMKIAHEKRLRCYFLGSTDLVLEKIKTNIASDFPNVTFGSFSPPYKTQFSIEENDEMINNINSFKPDFLFIGMTAPKQEKWLFANRNKLEFKAAASIGAVFDFYAGTVKRPSQFWINLGLEWLPRFLKEPKRLWKRNLISTPYFIFFVLKKKFFS